MNELNAVEYKIEYVVKLGNEFGRKAVLLKFNESQNLNDETFKMESSRCVNMMEVLTGATFNRRGRDWGNTISVGGSSTEKIARGFIQFDKVGADNRTTNLVPSVGSWGGGGWYDDTGTR